ncbi:MAG: TIR domain-containing protein [Chloroflexi bacterium]|nr:TIR domain-containing protein [Chloroflexota bacterium]
MSKTICFTFHPIAECAISINKTPMSKIFISYARENKETAKEIFDWLESEGHSPWLDTERLIPGQDWKMEIDKAIHDSDVFLACLSALSVNKAGFVQKELKRALDVAEMMPEGRIYIIPLCLDDCELPYYLQKYHKADYFSPNGKKKLSQAISRKPNRQSKYVRQEYLYDAGERIQLVREEIGLQASQIIEEINFFSEREYRAIESQEQETPLSLLKSIANLSGVRLEWLKHGEEQLYDIEAVYFNPIERDLEFFANLNSQEYFLTLNEKDLHVGLVAQTGKYRYQFITTGVTLDFWNWVENYWAIPAFYHFLIRLSGPWHDIEGIVLPAQVETKLQKGEMHFLSAQRQARRFGKGLLYDLLDLDETRGKFSSYKRLYGGNWMPKVHQEFRYWLEKSSNKPSKK